MKKAENGWWSRLLKQEGKPPVFLKVDWDKWVDEDEEEPENKCESLFVTLWFVVRTIDFYFPLAIIIDLLL